MNQPTDIALAASRLAGIVKQTPVMTSRTLNQLTGCEIYLKCENFQRVGAFKFRGAYNAVSQLSPAEKAVGVITHSSGNHAQGLALAAKLLGVKAVIVMPDNAPAIKKAATAAYGAEIVSCTAVTREQVTADLVAQHGYTLIHPYDNDQIIAGQGTAAWELFAEVGPLDALFVPVGGGGLISGSALAAAAQSPGCRVIGVEPQAGDDANRSWRENRIVALDDAPDTIADGLRTRYIGQRNLAIMRQYVSDMTAVSETDILATLEFLWTRMKLLVEPSSAVALAPLFTGSYPLPGQRVGVLLSGGNADIPAVAARLWGGSAIAAEPGQTSTFRRPAEKRQKRPRVLICDPLDAAGMEILAKTAVLDVKPGLSPAELLPIIGRYQAVIVGQETRLSEHAIEQGYNLRVIGCAGPRLDNIDVSTARAMGIAVVNVPSSSSVAIAEHVLAWMLTLASRFADGRLAGKTLGLIGFGQVGREVSRRARAFDMRVLVNQPRLTPELALSAGVEATDLIALLQESDFVSLHVPFKAETETIIGVDELALMKPSASMINPGHTDLIDEAALLDALANGRLSDAAVPELPAEVGEGGEAARHLRAYPRVMVVPHVSTIIGNRQRDAALTVARQIANLLEKKQPGETLSLELVPTHLVIPHEQVDEKRVARLMGRLEEDGLLVNPPVTTFWNGRYVVLDGATRSTAFKWLGYPHLIVQVVPPDDNRFELHTWYHVISSGQKVAKRPFAELHDHLAAIPGLILRPLPVADIHNIFEDPATLCYFLDREGEATVAQAAPDLPRLTVMNELVASYTRWGNVERTLLTDLPRLLVQFPQMTAVAVFPQFKPEMIFDVASRGELVPAGLTRFVIPGRILRLNADLSRLKQDEPLPAKRAWFNQFLEEKLAHSRLRYYEEPVILLDE
ncbi:MAG: pyridoxal-phosphate dependent enzyme [Chloroflexi bacterium]|nr:pyridoxal-phosphate dependent enzyme [Chloroflexota bacterium]MBP7043608.1 pyridoxal-phosphate dependent enzyme [Chloroflexota bacterium]